MDIVRSMRSNSSLPHFLWTEALKTTSHRLTVVYTHEVETGIRKPIIEVPHTFEPIHHVVEEPQNAKQPIEQMVKQQVPHEEATSRRSTRVKN